MLSRGAVQSAWALTEKLDAAGIVVRPVENTPLAALVQASRPPVDMLNLGEGEYYPDLDLIDHMANSPMDSQINASQHDLVVDEMAPVLFEAVRGHIHFARTVVSPVVDALASQVRQALEDQSASSLLGMEVIVRETPEVWVNQVLASAANKFIELPYDPPAFNTKLGELDAAALREIMASGTSRLDKDVDEWLILVGGDGFLLDVYNTLFRSALSDVAMEFGKSMSDRDWALATFLLARKLCEAVPPEGTEMSANRYEQAMVEFRNQAAKQVAWHIEQYAAEVKAGQLVAEVGERCCWVNAELYRKWIEEGGTNEVLFGNLLSKPALTTVSSINERAGDLLASWNKHSIYVTSLEANRKFERTKQFLSMFFHRALAEDTTEANLGTAEQVFERFQDLLDGVREGEMECLDSLCLRLVCSSRFPHTAAYEILDGINTAIKQNPQLEAREAALISFSKYVANWAASMFSVGV